MTQYLTNENAKHGAISRIGVLLVNLGTPDAPSAVAVRRYLGEFLADPRVIEVPRIVWWFILHGFILRYRPKRSASAYAKIWTDDGSPLLVIARQQRQALQNYLAMHATEEFQVELAMRYGQPSIKNGLRTLQLANAQKIIVLPLYPQYSATTTGSTFDAVADVLKTWRNIPELHLIKHYHDDPAYIDAIVASITRHWQRKHRPQKIIFSFHGLPKAYFDAGDPYYCECHRTAKLVAQKLALENKDWQLTFQSRFGFKPWLKPYTDKTLAQLARSGIKDINVICPGFSADCLETLEEINMQNRDIFFNAGGEKFSYIPALNDQPSHIEALASIIQHRA